MKPNESGKYEVTDKKGNVIEFVHAVDAREALTLKDDNGEKRYLPVGKEETPVQEPKGVETPKIKLTDKKHSKKTENDGSLATE
jgi:hypothetical protein